MMTATVKVGSLWRRHADGSLWRARAVSVGGSVVVLVPVPMDEDRPWWTEPTETADLLAEFDPAEEPAP